MNKQRKELQRQIAELQAQNRELIEQERRENLERKEKVLNSLNAQPFLITSDQLKGINLCPHFFNTYGMYKHKTQEMEEYRELGITLSETIERLKELKPLVFTQLLGNGLVEPSDLILKKDFKNEY